MIALRYPWHRENRPGVHAYDGQLYQRQATRAETNPSELPTVPKFELIAVPSIIRYGSLACYGGSGVAGFRITDRWQWTGEAGGCTLGNDLPKGWSGDSLIFMAGPQWVLHTESRWSPHLDMRVGGQKVTEDYCLKYGAIGGGVTNSPPCVTDPTGWARHYETTGPALSFGTGVDLRLTRAFELRLADLDYMHSWVGRFQGKDFSQGVRLSFGVGLEIGTW